VVERKRLSSKIIRSNSKIKELHFSVLSYDLPERSGSGRFGNDAAIKDGGAVESAEGILEQARLQAAQIELEARQRALLIESEARQQGYEQGLEAAHAQTAELIGTIKAIVESALQEKWAYINRNEANIVELALQIAEKILDEKISLEPEVVIDIARKAVSLTAEREQIRIRVNPDDVELLKAHKEDLMASMDGIQKIEVIADRRVGRGGCVVETVAGNVDARIYSQLCQIQGSLRDVVDDD
jgi:flagellar biosynthesis/type III secretory pathway protein FliH